MLLTLFRNGRLNSLLPWYLQRNRTEEWSTNTHGDYIKQTPGDFSVRCRSGSGSSYSRPPLQPGDAAQ